MNGKKPKQRKENVIRMSPEEMGWCRLDLIGCGYG
jgi:hypothetical protein